jgi:hyperosmotically inducible periplasmic protein
MSTSFRLVVLAALALCAATACSATRTQKSMGEGVDDVVIGTKIKADLIDDPVTKARQIDVTVFKGRVQLNGFVDSAAERSQAAVIAGNVRGVVGVDNNLKVSTDERTAGEAIDDAGIIAKVKAALVADDRTKAYQIDLSAHEGTLLLAGFVNNATARTAAGEIARGVAGVKSVDNQIAVK